LSTRGPHVSPTAVSCTTHVQSSTVVVARTIQSFIRDRAAEDGGHLILSPAAALPPMAAFHVPIVNHGPTEEEASSWERPTSAPQIRRLSPPRGRTRHPMQHRARPRSTSAQSAATLSAATR